MYSKNNDFFPKIDSIYSYVNIKRGKWKLKLTNSTHDQKVIRDREMYNDKEYEKGNGLGMI